MKSSVITVILVVVCNCIVTSLAMTSSKLVQMTTSSGAPVCSAEPPSQALSMPPGGEMMCGKECLVSDTCIYFQLNSLIASGQCQLYSTLPVNFTNIKSCVGFKIKISLSKQFSIGCWTYILKL